MATSRTGRSDALPKTRTDENERAMKLVAEMIAGGMVEIRPQLDSTSETGFTYPIAEQILKAKGETVLSVLEFLADKGILKRNFFDRLFRCPSCQSMNLRPSTHCPKCGSADIVRGRVLEHLLCKHVGIEDDFLTGGRYVCPKCRMELRTVGVDYQSLGLLRKCHDCEEMFNVPVLKWRCLKCSSLSAEDRVKEVTIYYYSLDEAKRSRLEFEVRPKSQLIEFLKRRGYEIIENATMKGRSGAEHKLDMLATRDDGIVTHNIAIGVEVAGDRIGLERIFSFDDKTYDIGIHNKILIVIPNLEREAETFASQQRIEVLEVKDLETVLATGILKPGEMTKGAPFEFKSKSQLVEFLKQRGYEVVENAAMKGRSGAEHNIDILATRDDGIVIHHIAIGVEVGQDKIGLDRVFDFDDKTYDIGIRDKVLIAVPGLTREAWQFAERQRIKVFEAKEL